MAINDDSRLDYSDAYPEDDNKHANIKDLYKPDDWTFYEFVNTKAKKDGVLYHKCAVANTPKVASDYCSVLLISESGEIVVGPDICDAYLINNLRPITYKMALPIDRVKGAIFKQRGDMVNYIPTSDVSAGDVIVQGDLIGIAKLDIKANNLGTLALTGVYAMPKATGSGEAIAVGAKVYWDAVNLLTTTDDASGVNKFLGKSILAASDGDQTVLVRLSQ